MNKFLKFLCVCLSVYGIGFALVWETSHYYRYWGIDLQSPDASIDKNMSRVDAIDHEKFLVSVVSYRIEDGKPVINYSITSRDKSLSFRLEIEDSSRDISIYWICPHILSGDIPIDEATKVADDLHEALLPTGFDEYICIGDSWRAPYSRSRQLTAIWIVRMFYKTLLNPTFAILIGAALFYLIEFIIKRITKATKHKD